MDIDAVRDLLRGTARSYMDAEGVYHFARGWYEHTRPWESFRSLPRSAQEADRLLGEGVARNGAPRWCIGRENGSDHKNGHYVMLPQESIDSLRERVERYSEIVRALASYFRLTSRFRFDTFQPILTLLGISRHLEVQNYAIQEVWNRIWCWQGMIRWMLMSTEGDGSLIPISELRLPRDWFDWLRNDHAFELGHIGAVIRWQSEGGPHPVVNWYLQRNVPMDWIWDASTAGFTLLKGLSRPGNGDAVATNKHVQILGLFQLRVITS